MGQHVESRFRVAIEQVAQATATSSTSRLRPAIRYLGFIIRYITYLTQKEGIFVQVIVTIGFFNLLELPPPAVKVVSFS